MTAVVRELNVYPLKSGGGTPLGNAEVVPEGFRHDRGFMLVRPDGRHLSQRELPRMALLRPSYDGVKLTVGFAGTGAGAPYVHAAPADGPVVDVTVHGKPCQGVDQGDEAADWFGALLERECRLVRFTGRRPTGIGGGTVAYADGYPLLVTSVESLEELNSRLGEPLPMNRFRPNIVIEGLGAWGEDSVRFLRIGDVELELVKPCTRCVITTTDQETAVKGREPLRTLASYRTRTLPDGERGVVFGQNAIPRTLGTITVGDGVTVLSR
ncbi:MOSC domain-containing protein [Actinoallomurus purpureus]|uniref:MOSC domain-containing protein n=1 Tax=Actinoallomurus purpureus TaxID=478114 RepID=UPI0020922123|nr:MOSC N-terminal beta barrel domain-containing protein [Actinoallomurus purpureus]MCO6010125.1 MOSC domain-containing protein [Actinoallomurus purpureus]